MNRSMDLSFLTHEPEDAYHTKADQFLTSHYLADFRRSPQLFFKRKLGLIPDEDRPAYVLGRAAHVRILEGRDRYNERFAVGGPVNPQTGKPYGSATKAFQEWAVAQKKPVLTVEQAHLIENLAVGVAMNEHAVDLIVDGVAEGVVREVLNDVRSQIRLDWYNPTCGIVDLKTTDDLTWFEADARRYGYQRQMAFYRAVLAQVIGGQMVPVHLIAVEKKEPFRCGVWRVSDDTLAIAQRENEAAIRRLLVCRQEDQWPTGYEEIRVLDVA